MQKKKQWRAAWGTGRSTVETWTTAKQMQLSEKKETFSQIFFAFLRPTLSFEHFPKKEDPHS